MLLSCNCSITKITVYDLIFFCYFLYPEKWHPPYSGPGGCTPPYSGPGGVYTPHTPLVNPSLVVKIFHHLKRHKKIRHFQPITSAGRCNKGSSLLVVRRKVFARNVNSGLGKVPMFLCAFVYNTYTGNVN